MNVRFLTLISACCCLLAAAYDELDHSIFSLVNELEAAEGKGVSFYDFLNVTASATAADVQRMYRKRSLELHPDKNKGIPGAEERFARLGVIAKLLRDDAMRKRYNFFHKNGVPRWKGTGWYYERYRPGLGSVIALLLLMSCVVQYVAQHVNYFTERQRVQRFQVAAKQIAYGDKPANTRRRVKVPMSAGSGGFDTSDKKAYQYGQQMLDMQVEGDLVWLISPEGQLPLDDSATTRPSILSTWIPSLFLSLFSIFRSKASDAAGLKEESEDEIAGSKATSGSSTPTERKRKAKAKRA